MECNGPFEVDDGGSELLLNRLILVVYPSICFKYCALNI